MLDFEQFKRYMDEYIKKTEPIQLISQLINGIIFAELIYARIMIRLNGGGELW